MASNKDNQRVLLVSSPDNLDKLGTDFQKLLQIINRLPCELIVDFNSRVVLRAQNTPTTYYGRERTNNLPAICEFPENHFHDPEQLRLIILLHELIHACQRQTILRRWDERTMNTLREFRVLANISISISLPQQRDAIIKTTEAEFQLLHSYFQIIFEAWNHLFMKENYPDLFEQEMINVHHRISYNAYNGNYDNWNEGFMFHMHMHLLEATFFSKITEKLQITKDFQKLADFWRNKLQSVCQKNQFQKLNSVVDTMTRINEFPNSQTLEDQYLLMCRSIWERKVFD